MAKRFDLRRSPVDGKFRRWEQRWASLVMDPQGYPAFEGIHGRKDDFKLWVCTGVFASRREVFAT